MVTGNHMLIACGCFVEQWLSRSIQAHGETSEGKSEFDSAQRISSRGNKHLRHDYRCRQATI